MEAHSDTQILTCKSFVILVYRGEILIKPSSSWLSDLTSVKSHVGSPVIQDLDIIMETDATVGSVGSGDDETNAVGKTVQMTATNSLKTDAECNSTQMTDSSSA